MAWIRRITASMMNDFRDRTLTFFYTDQAEYEIHQPVAIEAQMRGYRIEYSDNLRQTADIGFYCSHYGYLKEVSCNLGVIMLHDLGQGHKWWPDFWRYEDWSGFDIGFLPGEVWRELVLSCGIHIRPYLPKEGLHVAGWPKSDAALSEIFEPNSSAQVPTVLYAPSWENDQKVWEFIAATDWFPGKRLIKLPRTDGEQSWMSLYPEAAEAIKFASTKLAQNKPTTVELIDPVTPIMDILPSVDILVSDESSILIECMMFDAIPIAVTDWYVPPGRLAHAPFYGVLQTKVKQLRNVIESALTLCGGNYSSPYKQKWFSNMGVASSKILDVIESTVFPYQISVEPDVRQVRDIENLKSVWNF